MEPRVIKKGQMLLLGFGFFGDPFRISGGWTEENEIGRLWNRFIAYLTTYRDGIQHITTDAVMYEVHIQHEETPRTGEYEVFVGIEVEKLEDVPVEMSAKILPPTAYAVFTLQGEQITSDWQRMIVDWMLQSGYDSAYSYGLQRYDERFKGLDRIEESVLEAYVPVRR
jgi:AraC family transcriptional regulator